MPEGKWHEQRPEGRMNKVCSGEGQVGPSNGSRDWNVAIKN